MVIVLIIDKISKIVAPLTMVNYYFYVLKIYCITLSGSPNLSRHKIYSTTQK